MQTCTEARDSVMRTLPDVITFPSSGGQVRLDASGKWGGDAIVIVLCDSEIFVEVAESLNALSRMRSLDGSTVLAETVESDRKKLKRQWGYLIAMRFPVPFLDAITGSARSERWATRTRDKVWANPDGIGIARRNFGIRYQFRQIMVVGDDIFFPVPSLYGKPTSIPIDWEIASRMCPVFECEQARRIRTVFQIPSISTLYSMSEVIHDWDVGLVMREAFDGRCRSEVQGGEKEDEEQSNTKHWYYRCISCGRERSELERAVVMLLWTKVFIIKGAA